eukprot:4439586-Pyramimonas_sp.AAC.1
MAAPRRAGEMTPSPTPRPNSTPHRRSTLILPWQGLRPNARLVLQEKAFRPHVELLGLQHPLGPLRRPRMTEL